MKISSFFHRASIVAHPSVANICWKYLRHHNIQCAGSEIKADSLQNQFDNLYSEFSVQILISLFSKCLVRIVDYTFFWMRTKTIDWRIVYCRSPTGNMQAQGTPIIVHQFLWHFYYVEAIGRRTASDCFQPIEVKNLWNHLNKIFEDKSTIKVKIF